MSTGLPRVHDSVVAMLDHTVAQHGARAALTASGDSLSFLELRRCVAGLAAMLRNLAPGGGRVATVAGNSLVAALAPYAIAEAGCVHVPLNPLYTQREFGLLLHDAGPVVVLVDDELQAMVKALVPGTSTCLMLPVSMAAGRVHSWRATEPALRGTAHYPQPEAIALVQYTGGSTGRPKGVQLSHSAVNTNIAQREALLPVARGCEAVLCVMPLFHSYAMAMGLFLCGYSASTLVLLPRYQPQSLLDAVERHAITIFPGSPTIFTGLMNSEHFAATDWSRVHTCYSGSAALAAETLERWEAATGSKVFEGYGQTEAGPVLSFNPAHGRRKIGSVGVAVPGTDIEIVDVETGTRVLQLKQSGEIRARGPQLMAGYLHLEQETRDSLRNGWLYTGDIGELDEEGYLFIRDRKKDMVIVGGYNVYPREVEEVLYAHPAVLEAAAVGQPDAYRGEILRAYVALKPSHAVSSRELLEFCKQHLAKYKVPAAVEIMSELPRTAVNKIDKKPLKLFASPSSSATLGKLPRV